MKQDGQHVYYLTPDRKIVTRVTTDLEKPSQKYLKFERHLCGY
jgi:hypothetical protein